MKALSRLGIGATPLIALFVGCATVDEAYFLNTKTKANVYAAPGMGHIKKIAIMPFKASNELMASSVADIFVTEMLRAARYDLVERNRMAQVLSESELALAGLSAAKATEVGTMMGAEAVVIGTVDEYTMTKSGRREYPLIGITARLIDCKSGQVIWSVDLAKRGDDSRVTLPEHARVVIHEMVAALYRRWRR